MPVVLLREKPGSWEGEMEWWLERSLAHVTKAEISSQPTCSRSLRKHAVFLSQTNIGDTNFSLWEFWNIYYQFRRLYEAFRFHKQQHWQQLGRESQLYMHT